MLSARKNVCGGSMIVIAGYKYKRLSFTSTPFIVSILRELFLAWFLSTWTSSDGMCGLFERRTGLNHSHSLIS